MMAFPGLLLLPGIDILMPAHRLAGQQHDNLCGTYWTAMLLNTFGSMTTTSEEVSLVAGSILPIGDPQNWVPPGASPRQDYALKIPETDCLTKSGTSAQGLIHAVSKLSGDRFCYIPLNASWSPELVNVVLELCTANSHWKAMPIANVNTGYFWGSKPSFVEVIAYLQGDTIHPPAADWSVGHFVSLAGLLKGEARSLVVVQDTYPTLGWNGYHLQPLDAIADSLNRPSEDKQGGILLFAETTHRPAIESALTPYPIQLIPWNNGTPW